MIYLVIGTKAQLIKMAPIMVELKDRGVPYRYISTGQHQETMTDILENFSLSGPDVILYKKGDVVSVISMVFWAISVLAKGFFDRRGFFGGSPSKDDYLLVHGDTLSTLIGAVVGRVARVRVVHVESGLRSFNYFHPFPEELTRVLTFRLSDIMFCPDDVAVRNMQNMKGEIVNTNGNTLYDSWRNFLRGAPPVKGGGDFGVVSLHRFENFKSEEAARKVISLVRIVAQKHDLKFVLHKPTERSLRKFGLYSLLEEDPNISFVPRMSYFDFMKFLRESKFLVSDGGSNQEECFYMGKPLLLLREKTERTEGLGENCVLSEFSRNKVYEFSQNIDKYQRSCFVAAESPSSIIVSRLVI